MICMTSRIHSMRMNSHGWSNIMDVRSLVRSVQPDHEERMLKGIASPVSIGFG